MIVRIDMGVETDADAEADELAATEIAGKLDEDDGSKPLRA